MRKPEIDTATVTRRDLINLEKKLLKKLIEMSTSSAAAIAENDERIADLDNDIGDNISSLFQETASLSQRVAEIEAMHPPRFSPNYKVEYKPRDLFNAMSRHEEKKEFSNAYTSWEVDEDTGVLDSLVPMIRMLSNLLQRSPRAVAFRITHILNKEVGHE